MVLGRSLRIPQKCPRFGAKVFCKQSSRPAALAAGLLCNFWSSHLAEIHSIYFPPPKLAYAASFSYCVLHFTAACREEKMHCLRCCTWKTTKLFELSNAHKRLNTLEEVNQTMNYYLGSIWSELVREVIPSRSSTLLLRMFLAPRRGKIGPLYRQLLRYPNYLCTWRSY